VAGGSFIYPSGASASLPLGPPGEEARKPDIQGSPGPPSGWGGPGARSCRIGICNPLTGAGAAKGTLPPVLAGEGWRETTREGSYLDSR
jgi:hypothetical protein